MLIPLRAMVRKDLQLFFSDRRSVIMAFAVPIVIASFFGSIFSGSGSGSGGAPPRITIAIADEDGSTISKSIVTGAESDDSLAVSTPAAADAREGVRHGNLSVAVVIPKGFGEAAGQAFFSGQEKPSIDFLYDPSHVGELAMVRGIMTQHVMESVSREMFSGPGGRAAVDKSLSALSSTAMPDDQKRLLRGLLTSVQTYYNGTESTTTSQTAARPGLSMPYATHDEAVTAQSDVPYNGYAHAFAGMGIQFLLFAAVNLGIEILTERQRGLWKRLRSAPVSRLLLLGGKTASITIISLITLLVSFAFAMVVFHVRIQGSIAGFFIVAIATALMAATFGLLIASLGKTPASARGASILAVLVMVMLGGAWVPTFIFPAWLQRVTVAVPTRWAVDGLDAMTWRGIGLSGALMPALVLLGFAMAFGTIAVTRFRWEEE